jgi:hypothetical protein
MSHEGRTPPHPGKHPALTGHTLAPAKMCFVACPSDAPDCECRRRMDAWGIWEYPPPDWRHPGPRYLQPDTEWPERAECNFEVTR